MVGLIKKGGVTFPGEEGVNKFLKKSVVRPR
jgi:hypothetical protein